MTKLKNQTQQDKDNGHPAGNCLGEKASQRCTVVRIRLRPGCTPVTYAVKGLTLKEGEWVLVPTEHGPEVGQVIKNPIRLELPADYALPMVSRLATTSEIEDYYKNLELEQRGRMVCQRFIDSLNLKMKLVKVERFFDGSKIIFYYSADGRVDFRELVKELVRELRIRVEMRQIGIRHEAKLIGGIGCCGRELCCASFLSGFDPISIKMAKAQNLPLNPSKISGFCGRLLCCLTYEYETYKEMSQDLPGLGKACATPDGQGKVVRHNIFRQAVTVAMPDGSFIEYTMDQLDGTSRPEKNFHEPARKHDRKKRQVKKAQKREKGSPDAKQAPSRGKGQQNSTPGKKASCQKGQGSKKSRKRGSRRRQQQKKKPCKTNQKKKGDKQKS